MGIYTDLANSNRINGPAPRVGLDRSSAEQLLAQAYKADPDVAARFAASDEQAVIPEQTDAGLADTYTLALTFYGASSDVAPVTTAAIAYDAVDTVIETAIDVAMTGASFPGWTNGDISVSMAGAAGLDDGSVTLDFDGASVAGTPIVTELAATGFNATGPITRTAGQGDRPALQALYELNAVEGAIPAAPDAPVWTRPGSNGQSRPRADLLTGLSVVASDEDGTDEIINAVAALYPKA